MITPRKSGMRALLNLLLAATTASAIGAIGAVGAATTDTAALLTQQQVVDALLRGDDARPLLASGIAAQAPAPQAAASTAAGFASRAAALQRLLQPSAAAKSAPETLRSAVDDLRAQILLLQYSLDRDAEKLHQHALPADAITQVQQRQQELRARLQRIDAAAATLAGSLQALGKSASIPDAPLAELRELLAVDQTAVATYGANLPLHRPRLPAREPALTPAVVPSYAISDSDVAAVAADFAAGAEAPLSPLILDKARSLGNDYTRIVDFVRSQVRTQWYAGAQQGAEGTLRSLAGNDVDQASLLIALLRASRAPARYVRGVLEVRSEDLAASLGVRSDKVGLALAAAGVAHKPVIRGGRIAAYAIEHVFVSALLPLSNYRGTTADLDGRTWIPLAPALKPHSLAPAGAALARAGMDATAFIDDYLAEPRSETPLQRLRQQLDSRLAALTPPLRYDDLLAQHRVDAAPLELLPTSLPAATLAITGEFAELPPELRQQVRIVLRSGSAADAAVVLDTQLPLSQLIDRRVTVAYQPAGIADGAIVDRYGGPGATPPYLYRVRPLLQISGQAAAQGSVALDTATPHRLEVTVRGPAGESGFSQQLIAGGYAALVFDAQVRQPPEQAAGTALTGDSEPAAARLLSNLGARYLRDWDSADEELARLTGVAVVRPFPAVVLVLNQYRIDQAAGIAQSMNWRGVALDAAFRPAEAFAHIDSNGAERDWTALSALHGSNLEHRLFEQQWRVESLSADKGLQLARSQGLSIDTLTPASGTGTLNHPPEVIAQVAAWLARGYVVDIPRNPLTLQAWTGAVWRARSLSTGEAGYFIAGNHAGGVTVPPPSQWYLQELVTQLGDPYALPVNDDPLAGVTLTLDNDSQDQEAVAGQALPQPLRAIVLDGVGAPVRGADVTFRINDGNGRLGADSTTLHVLTDVRGVASATFTTGARIRPPLLFRQSAQERFPHQHGAHTIEVSAAARIGTLISGEAFRARGIAGPAAQLLIDDEAAPLTAGYGARSMHVRLLDANDNGIANAPLTLRAETHATRSCPLIGANALDASLYMPGDCPAYEALLTGHACTRNLIGDLQTKSDGLGFGLVPGNALQPSNYTVVAQSGALQSSESVGNNIEDCYDPPYRSSLWFWNTLVDLPDSAGTTMLDAAPLNGLLRDVRVDWLHMISGPGGIADWRHVPLDELNFLQFQNGTPENVRYNDGQPGVTRFDIRAGDTPGKLLGYLSTSVSAPPGAVLDHFGWAVNVPAPQLTPERMPLTPYSTTTRDLQLNANVRPDTYVAAPMQMQLRADGEVVEDCAAPFSGGNLVCLFYRGLRIDRSKTYTATTVLNEGTPFRMESAATTLRFDQGIIAGYGFSTPKLSAAHGGVPANAATLIQVINDQYPKELDKSVDLDVSAGYACVQGTPLLYVLSQPASVSLKFFSMDNMGNTNTIPDWIALENVDQQAGLQQVLVDPRELSVGVYKFELTARTFDGTVEQHAGVIKSHHSSFDALTLSHTLIKGVDLYSGGAVISETDIAIEGRGPALTLQRTYASHAGDELGFLGRGWSADLDGQVLANECGQRIVKGPGGQGQRFEPAGQLPDGSLTFTALFGYHGTLVQRGGSYDFYSKDGTHYHYGQDDAEGPRLSYVEDTNGNRLTYSWEMNQGKPRVSNITDAAGRRIDLHYETIRVSRRSYGIEVIDLFTLLGGATGPGGLQIGYRYDDNANLIEVVRKDSSALGARYSNYEYQDFGDVVHSDPAGRPKTTRIGSRLTRAKDPLQQIERYYSYEMHWAAVQPPGGVSTQFRPEMRVKDLQEPDQGWTNLTYWGQRGLAPVQTEVRDGLGKLTVYDMNVFGGTELVTDPLQHPTHTTWNVQHRSPETTTDALQRKTTYTYDDAGNTLSELVESPHGNLTRSWTYYQAGDFAKPYIKNRVKTATDARGKVATYAYDERGNPTSLERGGIVESDTYTANGDRDTHTDGDHKVWKFRYDDYGNVREAETPLRHVVQTGYDERSRRTSLTDANLNTTRWKYDARDRVVETTHPLTAAGPAIERTVYNDYFNRSTTTTPRGIVIVRQLDKMGRLSTEEHGPYTRGLSYDKAGNVLSEYDFDHSLVKYEYDDAHRVSKRHEFGDSEQSIERTTVYAYDDLGHVTRETVGSGPDASDEPRVREYRYEDPNYNRTHVLRQLTDDAGTRWITESSDYDANGNVELLVDAEGRETRREYDDRNRLVTETAPLGKVTTLTYNGRDAKRTETRSNTGGSGAQVREWIYDDAGRQTTAVDALGERQQQEFDANGNVTLRRDARGYPTSYHYDARNNVTEETGPEAGQVSTYGYDKDNNRIQETLANGRILSHEYDDRGRRTYSHDREGDVEERIYSGGGLLAIARDAEGRETRNFYDRLKRLVRVVLPSDGGGGAARELVYTHTIHGEVKTETDARGATTTHAYDTLGRRTSTLFPVVEGVVAKTAQRYDDVGNVIAQVNAREQTTDFLYNDLNQRTEQLDAESCVSGRCRQSWTYDTEGNTLTHTDRRGILSVSAYDKENRLLGQSRDGLILQTIERDANGNARYQWDALNRRTAFTYDKANRKTEEVRAALATEHWTYYPLGDIHTHTDADGRTTTNTYTLRRFLESSSLAGETTRYTYDLSGNRKTLQRPKGEPTTWHFDYDPAGRLKSVTDPLAHATIYGYDRNNNRTGVTDANQHYTEFHYDARNRLSGKTYPGGASWQWRYDGDNNRVRSQAPNGRVSTTTFDALNRPSTTTYVDAPVNEVQSTTTTYDGNGNIRTVAEVDSNGTRTETRDYDNFDRLTHVTDGDGRNLDYRYDDVGNRTHLVDHDRQETVWHYNTLNQNTQVYVPGQGNTTQTYLRSGRLESITRPDSSTTTHSYNDAGRLASIVHEKSGGTIASYNYRYDLNGNRFEQIENNGATTQNTAQTTSYIYDDADRLNEVHEPGRNTVYTLDPVSNRTVEHVTDGGGAVLSHSILGYNNRDQLTTRDDVPANVHVVQTWDANGNLATQSTNGAAPRVHSYDARDRLIGLTLPGQNLSFAYHPDGLRREKSNGAASTRYQYDGQSLLAETNAIGNTLKQYRYSASQLISETKAGTTPVQRHFLLDALRSPVALLTQEGTVSARTSYDAFGEVRAQVSTGGNLVTPDRERANAELPVGDEQNVGFTGYIKDGESGLYYAKARYYDPATARFNTEDPEAGKDLTPPSLHRYLYAYGNPTVYVDPTGRIAFLSDAQKYLENLAAEYKASQDEAVYAQSGSRAFGNGLGYGLVSMGNVVVGGLNTTSNLLARNFYGDETWQQAQDEIEQNEADLSGTIEDTHHAAKFIAQNPKQAATAIHGAAVAFTVDTAMGEPAAMGAIGQASSALLVPPLAKGASVGGDILTTARRAARFDRKAYDDILGDLEQGFSRKQDEFVARAKSSSTSDSSSLSDSYRSSLALPDGLNPVPAEKFKLWHNYLAKRGVNFEIGTDRAKELLERHDAHGLFERSVVDWETNTVRRTIFLKENPNASTFYEEALHALDSLKGRPGKMELNGREIDAYEFRAKSILLNAAPKRFTYEEFRMLEDHLDMVKEGTY